MKSVKAKIKNFQSIDELEIDIQGFVCISGPTNIGKSAIIRAISGSLLGAPVVSDVRKGEKFCTVELIADDWSLKWEKGKGVNRYRIPYNSEMIYDKIGQGQFEKIKELGFESVQIGSDVIQPWFASQFEPIFLINKSGPAVTDFLSEVSRLKVLQKGIHINLKNKKDYLNQIKFKEADIEEIEQKQKLFQPVGNLSKLKLDLEDQLDSIDEYGEKIDQMQDFLHLIEIEAEAIVDLNQVKNIDLPVDTIKNTINSLFKAYEIYVKLEKEALNILSLQSIENMSIPEHELGDEIQRISRGFHYFLSPITKSNELIDTLDNDINIPESIEWPKILQPNLLEKSNEIEELKRKVKLLSEDLIIPEEITWPSGLDPSRLEKVEEIDNLKVSIGSLQEELTKNSELLLSIESELAEFNICPTCEQPVC